MEHSADYATTSNNRAAAPADARLFGEDLAEPAEAGGERTSTPDRRRHGQTDRWTDGRMMGINEHDGGGQRRRHELATLAGG